MLTFESTFLTCIEDNYSVSKMEKVAKYLIQRVKSAQSDEDFRQIQSQVRIIILTMLIRGNGISKKVVRRYNDKHERTLPVNKMSLAFALGAGTEVCVFDVVPSTYVYIIDRQLEIPDKQTCVVKADLEMYHPELSRVAYVTFEDNDQIEALLRETK